MSVTNKRHTGLHRFLLTLAFALAVPAWGAPGLSTDVALDLPIEFPEGLVKEAIELEDAANEAVNAAAGDLVQQVAEIMETLNDGSVSPEERPQLAGAGLDLALDIKALAEQADLKNRELSEVQQRMVRQGKLAVGNSFAPVDEVNGDVYEAAKPYWDSHADAVWDPSLERHGELNRLVDTLKENQLSRNIDAGVYTTQRQLHEAIKATHFRSRMLEQVRQLSSLVEAELRAMARRGASDSMDPLNPNISAIRRIVESVQKGNGQGGGHRWEERPRVPPNPFED